MDVRLVDPHIAAYQRLMPVKEAPDTSKFLLSPMPGLLIRLAVESGQEIKSGEELAVVEAMKMENVLRSERDGVIGTIHAQPGDSLVVDQKIPSLNEFFRRIRRPSPDIRPGAGRLVSGVD